MAERKRVVILGAGFAGLRAAQTLAKQAIDITIVDRRNHHTFQPLLYQVALAVLNPSDIAQPIRAVFRHHANVEVLMDEAISFDTDRKRVDLRSGAQLNIRTRSTCAATNPESPARPAPGAEV